MLLANRGHCLADTKRPGEALEAYGAAARLAPSDPAYFAWMREVGERLNPPTLASGGIRPLPPARNPYRFDPVTEADGLTRSIRLTHDARLYHAHGGITPTLPASDARQAAGAVRWNGRKSHREQERTTHENHRLTLILTGLVAFFLAAGNARLCTTRVWGASYNVIRAPEAPRASERVLRSMLTYESLPIWRLKYYQISRSFWYGDHH